MQGRPLFPQQIPATSDGRWPQTASFEQPPQAFFHINGVAPGQGYLPPNQQSALLFPHQSLGAPNGADPGYARPHGVFQREPSQPPFMANSGHNSLQNPVHIAVHNPVHNPYLSQQPPNGFLPPANQPSNHEKAALSHQFAPPRGFASGAPPTNSGSGVRFEDGLQSATQGERPFEPAQGPFNTKPYWTQSGPPGMQTAPTGRGPPQMGTGVPVRSARGAPIGAYAKNNGTPSLVQNGRNPLQNQHPSSDTNHTHQVPTFQPNGSHATKPARGSTQPESTTGPSNTRQLENLGKSGGGLKRPVESQGGDWKRQRTDGVRMPGWKAKETEAVDVSDQFALEDVNKDAFKKPVEKETDAHRLKQRQKQIDFGKNTLGYERYLEQIPRFKRQKGDPQTPKISQVCSKRSWDGQIKKWRRLLHKYDPPVDDGAEFAEEEYVPGYRGDSTGGADEDAAAEQQSAEEEEPVTVEASVFEEDEDEFVGL